MGRMAGGVPASLQESEGARYWAEPSLLTDRLGRALKTPSPPPQVSLFSVRMV